MEDRRRRRPVLIRLVTVALATVVGAELVYAGRLLARAAPGALQDVETHGRRLLQLVYSDQPPKYGPIGQPGNWGDVPYIPLAQLPDPSAAAAAADAGDGDALPAP